MKKLEWDLNAIFSNMYLKIDIFQKNPKNEIWAEFKMPLLGNYEIYCKSQCANVRDWTPITTMHIIFRDFRFLFIASNA